LGIRRNVFPTQAQVCQMRDKRAQQANGDPSSGRGGKRIAQGQKKKGTREKVADQRQRRRTPFEHGAPTQNAQGFERDKSDDQIDATFAKKKFVHAFGRFRLQVVFARIRRAS
jgi:hypothetical protein